MSTPAPGRAAALDALRGFAILTMALSGMLQAYDLPAWMYHAQRPPPSFQFDPGLPGLTWVDLVFPFFLFSMGAAMPLALGGRLARGTRTWRLAGYAVRRGLLLLAFGVYVQHVSPWKFETAAGIGPARWLWCLLAFVVLFPALARLPRSWAGWPTWLTRLAGWGGAAALLATVEYPEGGGGFWLGRADIIIVLLAHAATVGTLLWLLSRENLALRFGSMLAVLAIMLGAEADGWVRDLWHGQPQPFLEQMLAKIGVGLDPLPSTGTKLLLFGYLKYLLIVLPGTVAGDLLAGWVRAERVAGEPETSWSRARFVAIAVLMLGVCVLVCAGLQARRLPGTTWLAFAACAAGAALVARPQTALETLFQRVYGWGVLWLVIGLLVEPWEGGIRKDHATISYFFVTSGLASFALLFFAVWLDVFAWRRALWLLVASGQNPMIAYVGIRNLVPPVLGLLAIEQAVGGWLRRLGLAWLGFGWACVKTALVAAAAGLCTRLRVVWRT